jgi:hypothetical protein
MAPDLFATSILLLNATSGTMRVLATVPGVALKGRYCLDMRGRYHFLMRDATSHSLVTVGLVNGHVQKWADKAFGDLHSMHCLNLTHDQETIQGHGGAAGTGHSSIQGAASLGESPVMSQFNLIGIFPSPTPDAVSQDESKAAAAAANLWFLGITSDKSVTTDLGCGIAARCSAVCVGG